MSPRAEATRLVSFLATLLACVVAVVWMAGPYLLALFLGGMLAMLAYPVFRRFQAGGCGPKVAAGVVTGLMFALVVVPVTAFSVMAVQEGVVIGQELSELKEFSPKAITAALSRWELVRTVIGEPAAVNAKLKTSLQAAGQVTTAAVLKVGKGIPEFFLQLTLALIAFFFFLLDGKRFMAWLLGMGVLDSDVQNRLVDSFHETTISAVLAGLAAAAAQAGLIALGFLALGVPGAFLAGGSTFILAWLPVFGSFPASMAGILYLYVQDEPVRMGFMIGIGVLASVVDNLVRPLVLKGGVEMHPLVGLVAILGGIEMFGILGIFLGPILAALLLSLLKIWPVVAERYGLALEV